MGPTAQSVRGRGIGIVVGAAIAGAWAVYGAGVLAPSNAAWPVVAVAVAVCLVAAGVSVIRRSRQFATPDAGQRAASRRSWLLFALNLVGEIVLFNLAFWLLGRSGLVYMIPVISIIVGLHFVPMARFFRDPAFYWTAGLMIAAAAVTIVALQRGPERLPVGLEAVANALILWGTAAAGWLAVRSRLA